MAQAGLEFIRSNVSITSIITGGASAPGPQPAACCCTPILSGLQGRGGRWLPAHASAGQPRPCEGSALPSDPSRISHAPPPTPHPPPNTHTS